MSSDEDHLIGLVAAVNSIHRNSKYPVKFHVLVTSAAYGILLLVFCDFSEFVFKELRIITTVIVVIINNFCCTHSTQARYNCPRVKKTK